MPSHGKINKIKPGQLFRHNGFTSTITDSFVGPLQRKKYALKCGTCKEKIADYYDYVATFGTSICKKCYLTDKLTR